MKMPEKSKRQARKTATIIRRCPVCKSTDVMFYMGGQFGQYKCKNCGYVGALVIEEEIED
ncbi:hypothetical protein KY340_01810 [Candidatus Woesearchaeota archaeon]|nr:hypothetical protein [Candidatus Woesearchaeota archaeon]